MIPTREHSRIQNWAHKQDAHPAQIRRLKYDGEPAILTFTFGENTETGPDIYPISWDSFFAQFDLLKLSMAWDDRSAQFSIVLVEERSAAYPRH